MDSSPFDLKILVVDDQPEVRHAVFRLLTNLGYQKLLAAADGSEAIAVIEEQSEPIQLVICDLRMPTEDGLVLLRKIARSTSTPAIILMSGTDELILESAQRLGEELGLDIWGALPKPLAPASLAELLTTRASRGAVNHSPIIKNSLTDGEMEEGLKASRFQVWFQPQVDLATGNIIGVEALLRFKHPVLGLLGPEAFVRPAEKSGLIHTLWELALEESLRWSKAHEAAGWRLRVSVNLSKAGLNNLDLPEMALEMCRRHGVGADRVVMELTESTLATNPPAVLDILTRLCLNNFRLSLDDFGVGYASLEELQSLPFHEIKLDKLFVRRAQRDPRSRKILESTISMAKTLKLPIVAEGIETAGMLQLVTEMGCDIAQGYYIAQPMPADEMSTWLEQRADHPTATFSKANAPLIESTPVEADAIGQYQSRELALRSMIRRSIHDLANPVMVVASLSEMLIDEARLHRHLHQDLLQLQAATEQIVTLLGKLRQDLKATEPTADPFIVPDGRS